MSDCRGCGDTGRCTNDGCSRCCYCSRSLPALPDDLPYGFRHGAAVAFGLLGMAEAIRAAHPVVLRDADWHLEDDERGF